jgi:monovalent cation:H+ antiporter, CPA1 family
MNRVVIASSYLGRSETGTFQTIGVLLVLAALFAYLNAKFLKLAPAVGLMLQAFIVSLILITLDLSGVASIGSVRTLLDGIDFNRVLLHGLLSFLLFAGALQICLACLVTVRAQVLILATASVVVSTFVVGVISYYLLRAAGLNVPLGYALLFGALISPTDPVAVLALIRRSNISPSLQALVEGEAIFNDGIAVVVFTIILSLVSGETSRSLPAEAGILIAQQAVGGVVFGLALGYGAYAVIKTIDDYPVEILITLALVAGGYALAEVLGTSGPLAMAVAGIVIGNHARNRVMSLRTQVNLDRFWEMVDIILNAVLFVLIGLEAVAFAVAFSPIRFAMAVAAIFIVLFGRIVSLGLPLVAFGKVSGVGYRATPFLTWAGLRGAIPIALVLSVPQGSSRDILVGMTYVVVVFSILVQGSTLKYLIPREPAPKKPATKEPS